MFTIDREEIDWAGHKLVLETGRIARQADGAVLAPLGETTVLATVVSTAVAGQAATRGRPSSECFVGPFSTSLSSFGSMHAVSSDAFMQPSLSVLPGPGNW